MKKNLFSNSVIFLATATAMVLSACSSRGGGGIAQPSGDGPLPKEPDYADASQWYVTDRGGEADLFYIISTETGDHRLSDGAWCHYADTYADSLRHLMFSEMEGVDTLLSGSLNFFSPYYRQCSLQSFTTDSMAALRLPLAVDDVRRSFRHYMTHLNGGRPFILAGFSQGAVILLELLKEMDAATYGRLVAAYAIGTSIPQTMVDACPQIVAARTADDLGVTISYNSVRDAASALWPRSAIAINPVNWQTDATPAVLVTEPTPLLPVVSQQKDTLSVHLDSATNLLFVDGYRADDYMLPLIGKEGNYHSREIWLYRHQLRANMSRRAANYLKQPK